MSVSDLVISWGSGTKDAVCKALESGRAPAEVAAALMKVAEASGPGGWFILGGFDDRRRQGEWRYASGAALDFDYEDALTGEHIEVPPDLRSGVRRVADSGAFGPSVYYPTRRGFRVCGARPAIQRGDMPDRTDAGLVPREHLLSN